MYLTSHLEEENHELALSRMLEAIREAMDLLDEFTSIARETDQYHNVQDERERAQVALQALEIQTLETFDVKGVLP